MKNICYWIAWLSVVAVSSLSANGRIGGSLENVDLVVEDLYNEDDHNYGEKYYVINRNDHPMRVSIKIKDIINGEDTLIRHTIIVESHDSAELGMIVQKDLGKTADWKYEWQTRPD